MPQTERYPWKDLPDSSHDLLTRRIRALPAGLRVLDLGAAGGHLGRTIRDHCGFLAGIEPDPEGTSPARELYDEWRPTSALAAGEWEEPFDLVVCADVLEHLAEPEALLDRVRGWLKPQGTLLVSIPNVANVFVRLSLLAGRFPYAERGILDRTHLRFYTRATARALLASRGFRVVASEPTAMPYELAFPVLARSPLRSTTRLFARISSRMWPTLFGYQFILEAVKA